jgi:hypothetical protein
MECRSKSASTHPCRDVAHINNQMYGDYGNDIPKTTDVLNFVGILTNEP